MELKTIDQLAEEQAAPLLKIDRYKSALEEIMALQEFDGGGHITKLNPPTHSQAIRARMLLAEG